jgi:hypothetical protein
LFRENIIKKIIIAALAIVAISIACADAQDHPVYFKAPVDISGTGCPVDSFTVTGEESATLTIMFSKYDAADPPENAASTLLRSSCNFAVPVHVPAGWQVSTLTADWMGFSQGETEFKRQYFFADQAGRPEDVTAFNDPDGIDYVERDTLTPPSYTACRPQAQDIILRINSDVQAKGSDSYIGVDTVDLNNAVVIELNWRKCFNPAVLMFLLRN